MTEFKAGDKVEHRSWGAGQIAFGPFLRDGARDFYLMEDGADGNHRLVRAEALTLAAKFAVGDTVYDDRGTAYTIVAGPFHGVGEWYAVQSPDGKVVTSAALPGLTKSAPESDYTYEGVTYDLSAQYRDKDGDTWRFSANPMGHDGTPRGQFRGRGAFYEDYTLQYVVREYGPLTKING